MSTTPFDVQDVAMPDAYDRNLAAVFFEPYARDLATRIRVAPDARVLEIACGTGIATRALRSSLPEGARLVATDLNETMIVVARRQAADSRIMWRTADATALPFAEGEFDAVACQFGVMFFADRPRAFREARRVLRPGGTYVFSVWDRIDRNPIARVVQDVLTDSFPEPPRFFEAPFALFDTGALATPLQDARFAIEKVDHVQLQGTSPSAEDASRGLVLGTPLATELRGRGLDVEGVRRAVEARIAKEFGATDLRFPLSAFVLTASAG